MNASKIIFLINDQVRAVKGRYEPGGTVEEFKTLDQAIKVGDLAVVTSGTRHEMTVVEITEVDFDLDLESARDLRWIVQRIDTEAFGQIKEQEAEAISAVHSAERRRKRDELRKSLFADHQEQLKTLKIAHEQGDDDVTE